MQLNEFSNGKKNISLLYRSKKIKAGKNEIYGV